MHANASSDISEFTYVFMDFETTGMDKTSTNPADGHFPVSIGAQRVTYQCDGENMQCTFPDNGFYSLIQPVDAAGNQYEVDPYVADHVHGISTEQALNQGLHANDLLPKIFDYIGEDKNRIAFHNAAFDIPFFHRLCSGTAHTPIGYANTTCSLVLARARVKELKRHKIEILGPHFNVGEQDAVHNALDDSQLAARIFAHFCRRDRQETTLAGTIRAFLNQTDDVERIHCGPDNCLYVKTPSATARQRVLDIAFPNKPASSSKRRSGSDAWRQAMPSEDPSVARLSMKNFVFNHALQGFVADDYALSR